jgi:hypothetical protein
MGKHHVVPRDRGWAVKAEGKTRASAVLPTQAEAIAAAKRIAANQGGYVLIHRRDGTIRTEKVDRIAGTIKVEVASGDSLTSIQRKIGSADRRLKVLAGKVAAKKKRRDKKIAAKKPPAKRAPAKKSIGGRGLKAILSSASKAVKKLADQK